MRLGGGGGWASEGTSSPEKTTSLWISYPLVPRSSAECLGSGCRANDRVTCISVLLRFCKSYMYLASFPSLGIGARFHLPFQYQILRSTCLHHSRYGQPACSRERSSLRSFSMVYVQHNMEWQDPQLKPEQLHYRYYQELMSGEGACNYRLHLDLGAIPIQIISQLTSKYGNHSFNQASE